MWERSNDPLLRHVTNYYPYNVLIVIYLVSKYTYNKSTILRRKHESKVNFLSLTHSFTLMSIYYCIQVHQIGFKSHTDNILRIFIPMCP